MTKRPKPLWKTAKRQGIFDAREIEVRRSGIEMSAPKSFEELDAWQAARELTNEVYELCRHEPLALDVGLCDQLRRTSVSVMSNISEGWESMHVPEKIEFYNTARRSCGELRSVNYVLLDNHFISDLEHQALRDHCLRSGQLISGLIRFFGDRR
jgi:four helix bundle protein